MRQTKAKEPMRLLYVQLQCYADRLRYFIEARLERTTVQEDDEEVADKKGEASTQSLVPCSSYSLVVIPRT